MKYLFIITAVVLSLASLGTYFSYPQVGNPIPIIYWATDKNSQRSTQALAFEEWQIAKGHAKTVHLQTLADVRKLRQQHWSLMLQEAIVAENPDGKKVFPKGAQALADGVNQNIGPAHLKQKSKHSQSIPPVSQADLPITLKVPLVELRVDAANGSDEKKLIQDVAGVGSDIQDMRGGGGIRYFHAMGLLTDVTEAAKKYGFQSSVTWSGIQSDLTITNDQGQVRQYAFPCNVGSQLLWVNKDAFKKFHQPLPPYQWDLKTFETMGKAYVHAANAGLPHREYYYASNVDLKTVARSLGGSTFNETLTRCTLNQPQWVQALRLEKKWTEEDHILPSAAERSSFNTSSAFAGSQYSLFERGNYAMVPSGRWALIMLRRSETTKDKMLHLTAVETPNGGFPNCQLGTRAASVYVGSHHKKLAELFLAFLASKKYNMTIVRGGDAMPPNPKFTKTPAFSNPPDHPNEAGVSDVFARAVREIGVGGVYSPFVLDTVVARKEKDAEDAVMSDRLSPEEAARLAARDVNAEMQRDIANHPAHRALYEKLLEDQKTIDRLRKEGKKVPLKLIRNIFLKKYYQSKGWAE